MLGLEGSSNFQGQVLEPQVPSSHTIYAVLGFLEEYIGRAITQNGDLVEHFWVNETKKADIFEKYLIRLINEYASKLLCTGRCQKVIPIFCLPRSTN
jgi:hypothetical protein